MRPGALTCATGKENLFVIEGLVIGGVLVAIGIAWEAGGSMAPRGR